MNEKRISVEDQVWESENETFNKFRNLCYRFMYQHENDFCEDDNGHKPSIYLYLNKGYDQKKLDTLLDELYKELVELLGEATDIKTSHEEGFYSRDFEWNYPTHCYYVGMEYVYDGYEEKYYDISFDRIEEYDEDELEEMFEDEDLNRHRIGCGIEIYGDD